MECKLRRLTPFLLTNSVFGVAQPDFFHCEDEWVFFWHAFKTWGGPPSLVEVMHLSMDLGLISFVLFEGLPLFPGLPDQRSLKRWISNHLNEKDKQSPMLNFRRFQNLSFYFFKTNLKLIKRGFFAFKLGWTLFPERWDDFYAISLFLLVAYFTFDVDNYTIYFITEILTFWIIYL